MLALQMFVISIGMLCLGESLANEDPNDVIRTKLEIIAKDKTIDARATEMNALVRYLSELSPLSIQRIHDSSVDGISRLLEIDGDVGKLYGALALGEIACRADRALPELRRARDSSEHMQQESAIQFISSSANSAEEIDIAIRDIERSNGCGAHDP